MKSMTSSHRPPEGDYTCLKALLNENAALVDNALTDILKNRDAACEPLFDAMAYSLNAGGKRIRPFLVRQTCATLDGDVNAVMPLACAVEMIHTYSLIHDDLPCMDNDTLRRGKPTNHVIYGEATALLAGDSLLTYAFEVATQAELSPERTVNAIRLLAHGAGPFGMCGGQQIDLSCENTDPGLERLRYLQKLKTGRLIEASCLIGAAAAGYTQDTAIFSKISEYALCIGEAFQIIDDILDVTATAEELGKSQSDTDNGKLTRLSYMSREEAFEAARLLTDRACSAVGEGMLAELAVYLLYRRK